MVPEIILGCILVAIILHSWLRKRNKQTDDKLQEIKEKLTLVDPRANNINFYVNSDESYSQGKRDIFMCLRNSKGEYHDDNFLMYVGLHELAHALIPYDTSQHPPEFEDFFNKLKTKAKHKGLYDPDIPFPSEYCKKKLSDYY